MEQKENLKRVSLNGIEVYPFKSENQLLDFIEEKKGILVAINAEKILHATASSKDIINRNIGYCDGAGAMLALKKKGGVNAIKLPGCELWLKIINKFHRSKSFYLLGAKPAIIEETVFKLKKEFEGINILGYHDGYLTTSSIRDHVINEILTLKPDVVFVAMGSPKQELLMEELMRQHEAIYQGLGGSFDVYTGHVKRAPQWWISHNLEFAYRLLHEPKRIKRQIYLLKFVWLLLFNKL